MMCEKCDAIDETIAHYQRIARGVTDKLTLDRIDEKIRELETHKDAMHPEKPAYRNLAHS